MKNEKTGFFITLLSLFTSASTLLCCALPALLITLGMGAVMAGLVSNFPFIITLSNHKVLLFSVAGTLLILCGFLIKKANSLPCPIDPNQAFVCKKLRKINKYIYLFSVFLFLIGAGFAFLAKYFN